MYENVPCKAAVCQEEFGPIAVKKLIDLQDVDPQILADLPAPFFDLAKAVQAAPPKRKERMAAFEAVLVNDSESEAIRTMVSDADADADLSVSCGSSWQDLAAHLGPISWEWPGWMPKALLTLLVSAPGVGKSSLLLRIAACYLRGDPWPDDTPFTGELGKVLWCEAEAAQALNLERARNWGLPLDQIRAPFSDPMTDIRLDDLDHRAAFERAAHQKDLRLIVIDSFSGTHGRDENSSESVLTVKFLAEIARDTGVSVVLTHHLRKKGLMDGDGMNLDRVRGSSAIPQTARVVWALDVPDPNYEERKRLSVIKNNLARFAEPIGMTIDDTGLIFGDAPEPPKQETVLDQAIDLLRVELSKEPKRATYLQEVFDDKGISWSSAKRAKEKLYIAVVKKSGAWYWSLPAREE